MKLVLKEFQLEAVDALVERFADARRRAAAGRLEVVTLSAPTGSGKTVILTRLLEFILEGTDLHPPDPEFVVLWVTDQPELNTQTRDKMRATSDVLDASRLVEIGPEFDYETFPPGRVYFLNTQKLGSATTWIRTSDTRTFTLWDTIRNTVTTTPGRFCVIIDEAHRGTKLDKRKAEDANSIMQKFVLGSEEIPAIPLVLGLSATLDPFLELLSSAAKARRARTHQRVDIAPADVVASGLLKRKVVLHHPDQPLAADYPLLRDGIRTWLDLERRWAAYCSGQGEPQVVRPILLVQVEDGTKARVTNTDLDAVVNAMRDETGGLEPAAIAHAFQEGHSVSLGDGTLIRYLGPAAIDGDAQVKVVLFKVSLNTGWDCPRAEVMVSFRTARDATLIAQLVGRMIRAPLARLITEDDALNSVSLLLPNYDRRQLEVVIRRLTDPAGDVPPTELEDAAKRVVLQRASSKEACFEALAGVPTGTVPRRRRVSERQRLGLLADALSHSGLKTTAASEAREHLVDLLESEYGARKNSPSYRSIVKEDGTIPVQAVVLDYGTGTREAGETRNVPVSEEMVSELYEWARRQLGLELGQRYWRRRAERDHTDQHMLTKLEVYALAADAEVIQRLEEDAAATVSSWLNTFKPEINTLPERERAQFDEIRQQSSMPEYSDVDLPIRRTLDWSIRSGSTPWREHIYQDTDGMLPEKLNSWEAATLKQEMEREDFVGWLRNRERQPWAVCIPYQLAGVWKGMYPDFLIFRRQGAFIVVDIVDPHLTTMEDAAPKAAALAAFAAKYQDRFGRVDLVVVDAAGTSAERVKRLSLLDDGIRRRILGVQTSQHLRDLYDLS